MLKRLLIFCLIIISMLSCEKKDDPLLLWGIWNIKKITNENNAYSIVFDGKNYRVIDSYVVITKDKKNVGIIRDISERLIITKIDGKYPVYNLSVELIDKYNIDNKQIEKKYFGNIIVHFINDKEIWFENGLNEDLYKLIKSRYFSIEFGSNNIFYRAEQIDKPIHRDSDQLE